MPQPPYGPLTSTEHLLPGDLVRSLADFPPHRNKGEVFSVVSCGGDIVRYHKDYTGFSETFTFIGRPDKDGWIAAPDGGWPENPCPWYRVEVLFRDSDQDEDDSNVYHWPHDGSNADITAIRILGLDAGEVGYGSDADMDRLAKEVLAPTPDPLQAAADDVRAASVALGKAVKAAIDLGLTVKPVGDGLDASALFPVFTITKQY